MERHVENPAVHDSVVVEPVVHRVRRVSDVMAELINVSNIVSPTNTGIISVLGRCTVSQGRSLK